MLKISKISHGSLVAQYHYIRAPVGANNRWMGRADGMIRERFNR